MSTATLAHKLGIPSLADTAGVQWLGDYGSGAVLSNDARYRYLLWRNWPMGMGFVAWVMLNPSTANHTTDDATIRRCANFSYRWGYAGIVVVNLFGLRSTDPAKLLTEREPIGATDLFISAVAERANLIVAAWGAHGNYFGRSIGVRGLLSHYNVMCLGKCSGGEPKHPVRLANATEMVPYLNATKVVAVSDGGL